MLLSFAVENFKGIRTRQELDLNSNLGNEFEDTIMTDGDIGFNLCSCLVGPNGSGKTHILSAISKFVNSIKTIEDINTAHSPFLLDQDSASLPTKYEALLYNSKNATMYNYLFSVLNGEIVEEKLEIKENKKGSRKKLIFERNESKITFGKGYATQGNLLKSMITSKGLIIYYAQGLDIEHINFINTWANLVYLFNPRRANIFGSQIIEEFEKRINNTSEDENSEESFNKILSHLSKALISFGLPITKICFEKNESGKFTYKIKHKVLNGEEKSLSLEEAKDFFSDGTFNTLNMTLFILLGCNFGSLVLLDEYDDSLHHNLSVEILKLIRSLNKNNNSQAIITSHDILILDNGFRRDSIFLIEKNDDLSTQIKRLSDFSLRKDTKISLKYLNNEFGSLPKILTEI